MRFSKGAGNAMAKRKRTITDLQNTTQKTNHFHHGDIFFHRKQKEDLYFLDIQKISNFPSNFYHKFLVENCTRLVIGTSRTVGSAKEFVRITSGFGGGEFTKTFRKVCTCQKLKFSFLLLKYCKIRECYAVVNAFTIRNMHSLFLYMKCNSRKINRPTKNITKSVTLVHF